MTKQFDCVWENIQLATMCDGYGEIHDAALAISDGKIAWLGPRAELPAHDSREVRDGGGCWVTPGLIDCHTHMVYAGNRSNEFEARLNGASYVDIAKAGGGINSTVRATRAASADELYQQSLPRIQAALAEGVTTLEIKSGYGLDLASEAKMLQVARRFAADLPVRVRTTFLGAHALPPEYAGQSDAYIDLVAQQMLPELARQGLVDAVDVFCENIGFSPAQTERVFAAAQALGLPVKLHAEQLSDQGGAALVAKYQGLSADHLEYLSAEGIAAMAAAGTVAVLLPGAFYYLRETKLPPLEQLRAAKVSMALATDCNPGTSPMTSLLLTMNMACTLFRMTPLEALQGVTCHAARALGLQEQTGQLKVGLAADLAFWQITRPADLAYHIGGRACQQRVVAGELV